MIVHRQRTTHGLGTIRGNRRDNASIQAMYAGAVFLLAGFLVLLALRNVLKKA